MTPSAWLSFSTELSYLSAVLCLLAVIAFKLAPIRAVRYWWVRRERDRVAAIHRRMEFERVAKLPYKEQQRWINGEISKRVEIVALMPPRYDLFAAQVEDTLRRIELEGLSSAMDKAERRIIH